MIRPKVPKLTDTECRAAYVFATQRDGDACVLHGLFEVECFGAIQRDHRQNRTPFNTTPANLQCLCVAHHKWKTEHPAQAERWGLAVRSTGKPALVPVFRWGLVDMVPRLGWWLVDAEGMQPISESLAGEYLTLAGVAT